MGLTNPAKPLAYCIAIFAFGALLWSLRPLYDAVGVRANLHSSSLAFDIPHSDPVGMIIHNTQRYGITPGGAKEIAALIPPGGHLIYLGSPPKAYTPTLFHQMKCLGIIHAALIDIPPHPVPTPTPLISHCLNYLRQTILCQPNLRLESATNANASSEKEYETVCRNWEAVYTAAQRNHKSFSALQEKEHPHP